MTDAAKAWQAKWGGFVHPHPRFAAQDGSFYDATPGMTLRDHFAGLALSNVAAFHQGQALDPVSCARICYEYADAMIAARGGV